MLGHERLPGIVHHLLQAERNPALVTVNIENHHIDLLRGGDDLARMKVFLRPAHLRDMDETLNAILKFNEGAVISDVGHTTRQLGADRILGDDAIPRIGHELLHAERDALRVGIDLDDLNFDFLTDFNNLARMRHALPAHVGDMQQAVDASKIHESAVVGDVLHHAPAALALGHIAHDLSTLLGAAFLQHRAPGHDDVAAGAIHLEDCEGLGMTHQRANIADGPDIHLRTGKEGVDPAEVDGEAALNPTDDLSLDGLFALSHALQAGPGFLAPGLVPGQNGVAESVLDTLKINFDDLSDFRLGLIG